MELSNFVQVHSGKVGVQSLQFCLCQLHEFELERDQISDLRREYGNSGNACDSIVGFLQMNVSVRGEHQSHPYRVQDVPLHFAHCHFVLTETNNANLLLESRHEHCAFTQD